MPGQQCLRRRQGVQPTLEHTHPLLQLPRLLRWMRRSDYRSLIVTKTNLEPLSRFPPFPFFIIPQHAHAQTYTFMFILLCARQTIPAGGQRPKEMARQEPTLGQEMDKDVHLFFVVALKQSQCISLPPWEQRCLNSVVYYPIRCGPLLRSCLA